MFIFHVTVCILKASLYCDTFDVSHALPNTSSVRAFTNEFHKMMYLVSRRGCCLGDWGPRCKMKVSGRFSGYSFFKLGQIGKKWK